MAVPVGDGGSRWTELLGRAARFVETDVTQASERIQTGDIENPADYSKVCLNLGSSIDKAVAMNEVPSSSHLLQLPLIVREVYRRKTDLLQPSLMLLMLSVKAACRIGWFPDEDKNDLLIMAKEVSSGFCGTDKMSVEPSYTHSYVSNIISRFYPNLKVESIVTSFDVKAGYGTYVADFHISRGTLPRRHRHLYLLVARTDNMDTSACIASPPNVDFLINGTGVPRRTRSDMGKGPQLPSYMSKMIKFGVNLLQVFGDFDGPYIVAVAFMNFISNSDPQLQDYVEPVSGGVDSDCDVIETSSRISLKCPISQHRIRTPVKGHLCKHPQCYDYKYFMEMNSRWPIWKCPLCNKPVCNLDIRIDRKLVKILKKVAEDVNDVIISADGKWKAALETETNGNTNTMSQNNHVPETVGNTLDAVAPVRRQQSDNNSRLQTQGSFTMVPAPPSKRQIRHNPNPVNLTTTQAFHDLTNPSAQTNVGTTEQAQSPTPPHALFEQRHPTVRPGQSAEPSGDAMPTGRMRGSLTGAQLVAARLQFLAPPPQPDRANKPWSKPTPTLPIALLNSLGQAQPPNNQCRDATTPPGLKPTITQTWTGLNLP